MDGNKSEDQDFADDPPRITSGDESVPNFAFHCLKDDPDIKYEFKADDDLGIDINDYLDDAISSNLETIDFKWESECLLCAQHFEDYQELLEHCQKLHKNEFEEYACTLQDCDLVIRNEKQLARHLVLQHADLESIQIYCCCPCCDYRCANFTQLNKHSCYRKFTRKACIQPYCQYCKEEFISHKRFLFHLQFHLAKRRSKICLICNASFDDVDEFFVHVNYAHEPPGTMACSICDRVFTDMEAYNAHQEMHTLKSKYKCDKCSRSYYDKRFLAQHKQNVHGSSEHKCGVCSKIFPTSAMLQTHMKWHKEEAEVLVHFCTNCGLIGRDSESLKIHHSNAYEECFECNIEETMLVTALCCDYCSQDFIDKDSLRSHRSSGIHDDGKFDCPLCTEKFDSYKAKRLHITGHKHYKSRLESLPLKRYFMCDEGDCDVCYFEMSSLHRHKKRIHRSTICKKCDVKFTDADELQNHIKQCIAEGFVCQFCNKMCPTKMSLAIHVSRSHNNKSISCPHCSCLLKDEEKLKKHIDTEHVPVTCEQCDALVANRRYLASHIKSLHGNEFRYFCAYCNEGYYFRSQRDSHEEITHPGALYKCGECNYKTKYSKSLEIHVAKHLKQEKLLCPYCSRMFGRSNSLKMHIKRHENDKPFRCSETIVDGCDAAYISLNLLNNHIKSKHANQWAVSERNVSTKAKNKTPVAKRKLTRKTKTATSTIKALKRDQDQNGPESNMLYSFADAGVSDLTNDKLVCAANDASNNNDDNYMLLIMDNITMPMDNMGEQLYVLENNADTDMITALNVP